MRNWSRSNPIVVLLLLCGGGMALAFPPIVAAGFFCAVVVPTVMVAAWLTRGKVVGKKHAIPLAVVGFAWFVIAVIMNM